VPIAAMMRSGLLLDLVGFVVITALVVWLTPIVI
jgi:hypothetical protein